VGELTKLTKLQVDLLRKLKDDFNEIFKGFDADDFGTEALSAKFEDSLHTFNRKFSEPTIVTFIVKPSKNPKFPNRMNVFFKRNGQLVLQVGLRPVDDFATIPIDDLSSLTRAVVEVDESLDYKGFNEGKKLLVLRSLLISVGVPHGLNGLMYDEPWMWPCNMKHQSLDTLVEQSAQADQQYADALKGKNGR